MIVIYVQDINECEVPSYCDAPGTCQNLMGSSLCQCPAGYQLDSTRSRCLDVNECVIDKEFCREGLCTNTVGSAEWECSEGWALDPTGRDCVDQREGSCFDEHRGGFCLAPRLQPISRRNCCCTKGEAWGSTGDCEACPAPGTQAFDRLCPLGMGRGGNGEDFNECAMMKDLCSGGSCINTDGSYRCECPKGFDLDTTGSRCTDMDECVLNSRICGNGTCTNVEGGFDCACASGYAPGFSGIPCFFFSILFFLSIIKDVT